MHWGSVVGCRKQLEAAKLPGGGAKKICQVSSLELNVGAQAGQVTNLFKRKLVTKSGHFWQKLVTSGRDRSSASGFEIQGAVAVGSHARCVY